MNEFITLLQLLTLTTLLLIAFTTLFVVITRKIRMEITRREIREYFKEREAYINSLGNHEVDDEIKEFNRLLVKDRKRPLGKQIDFTDDEKYPVKK